MIGPDTQEELNALVDEIKSHWFEHIIFITGAIAAVTYFYMMYKAHH